ncbi:MAG: regulatory protein GemA [Firmicutes bacterium]|nr:regulatory protein GemA [Bacillota bacterium]
MARITKSQMRMIWASARELDLDEDLLRTTIRNVTGSSSISNLTKAQAKNVIDHLQRFKGREPEMNMASNRQKWKIKQLASQLGWDNNPKRLSGFVKKYAGVENMEWITADMAWRIIEGLKKIRDRQQREGCCND